MGSLFLFFQKNKMLSGNTKMLLNLCQYTEYKNDSLSFMEDEIEKALIYIFLYFFMSRALYCK